MDDVVVINESDIWAVGEYLTGTYGSQTLTVHWDGAQWSYIPSPNPSQDNHLRAVSAISSTDIWAVGVQQPIGPDRTLAMHWDGVEWSIVPSPNPGTLGDDRLFDVVALSTNDVWAVGLYYVPSGWSETLIIHWDGVQWSVVPSPSPVEGDNNILYSIAAITPNDIWAVGEYAHHSLMLHWDGVEWSLIPSPDPAPDYGHQVFAVTAISTDDVWAVGVRGTPSPHQATLTLHWDGVQWSRIDSPNFDSQINYLFGVTSTAHDDVWAVGWTGRLSLAMHWDGVQWSQAASENVGGIENYFFDVDAVDANNAWIVGSCQYCYGSGVRYRTLVEHYTGPCASTATPTSTPTPITITTPATPITITPGSSPTVAVPPTHTQTGTPNLTVVPGTPTFTPTPHPTQTTVTSTPTPRLTHTATPTATPTGMVATVTSTACTVTFTDVPVGSAFYEFIRCLACRGIINGYADRSFKPNNNVTRGQLSKIVSNSAGFGDPQSTQTFQDVPVGSTFFDFIGRLASRGYSAGYACGGSGEPCVPPGNLPYFRPNANATRGQISKIVSNAAGFSEPHTEQTFQDVPPGSTFYDFIERLVSRGVMSGYPCGGAGEPCVPPENRSYFRPNNNATRGQTSKIVANTFFLGCSTPGRR